DNGKTVIAAIPDLKFDLAILDVMLPGADGFEIAETIRKTNKNVPILFLSAKSLKEDRIHGLRIGADDYITKPFSIEELLLKIEIFLKRTQPEFFETEKVFDIGRYHFDYENLSLTFD